MEQNNLIQTEPSYHPKHNIKVYVWIALVVAAFLGAINGYLYFLRLSYLQQRAETAQQNEQKVQELRQQRQNTDLEAKLPSDMSDWKTYRNEEYGFEFRYPGDWKIFSNVEFEPIFIIYKYDLPTNYFPMELNLSVYPQGIPTEGITGQFKEIDNMTLIKGKMFAMLLEDGNFWGYTVSSIENKPKQWNESGFIWAATDINNLEKFCLRNGQIAKECDLYGGDKLIRRGQVNSQDLYILNQILSTFRFIE